MSYLLRRLNYILWSSCFPYSTFHQIWSQKVRLSTDILVFYRSLTLHWTVSGCSLMICSHLTFRHNRWRTESIAIAASDWFTQALHLSPGDATDGLVQSNFAIRYEYWPFSSTLPVIKRYILQNDSYQIDINLRINSYVLNATIYDVELSLW